MGAMEANCGKCLHQKVCALWWAHERQDASCFCSDGCDYFTPTLTPPNEWVSVEQAMPPEHETVLCIVSGKPKPNIMLEDAYQLGSWNKADGWIIDEWLDWEGANVTWWMKLPAPPDRRPPEGEEGDANRG